MNARRVMPLPRASLMHAIAASSVCSPPPCGGGVGGGGRSWRRPLAQQQGPPSPPLPHKGGGSRPSPPHALVPFHSITSSAVASSLSGTVRPSILAVGTLMTSSNLVDCTTGKSAGFAPLRMRPV